MRYKTLQRPQNNPLKDNVRDRERELVAHLVKTASRAGIADDPIQVKNFYIALKTKPLVILTGPRGSGKIALTEHLSQVLKSHNRISLENHQIQMLVGHPWWVGNSENMALFTNAHLRFNTDKLLFMVSEAWRPENSHRLFIACLTRISPAELMDFFCQIATQISQGGLTRLGKSHIHEPIPFPPNLRMVGTMDTLKYRWWDADLLSQTLVIPWTKYELLSNVITEIGFPLGESIFLKANLHSRDGIYKKIHSILSDHKQPLLPLVQIESLLIRNGVQNTQLIFEDSLAYLANSWSNQGGGLFSPSTGQNLAIALDLVISQIILPRVYQLIGQINDLGIALDEILTPGYPRSASLIKSLYNYPVG
jgi:energy-coupling factor transporter ATP-binding protein EcfA2